MRGKTLGIVGYGNIGAQLSVLAEMLGMRVVYFDVAEKLPLGNARKCLTLQHLLAESDVVTVHVDGRTSNTKLFGAREFAAMKQGAHFINLSRGHVVAIDALAEALERGHLAGAALDVYPEEPRSNGEGFVTPLQGKQNVILTPHVGGSTQEAQRAIAEFVTNKLILYWKTGDTTLSVNLPNLTPAPEFDGMRFTHIHENVPGVLAAINAVFAQHEVNISGQYLGTNDAVGYVVTDTNAGTKNGLQEELAAIEHTIRVRALSPYSAIQHT